MVLSNPRYHRTTGWKSAVFRFNLMARILGKKIKKLCPKILTFIKKKQSQLNGLALLQYAERLKRIRTTLILTVVYLSPGLHDLQQAGIIVSLFVDSDKGQIRAAKNVGADYVEIHTDHYADSEIQRQEDGEFKKTVSGIAYEAFLGLRVNVRHGLNYRNTQRLAPIKEIEDYSIGQCGRC